jgi:hypothetical protein
VASQEEYAMQRAVDADVTAPAPAPGSQPTGSQPTGSQPARNTSAVTRHPTAVLVVILSSHLMIFLDISIVITVLAKMRTWLGFSTTGLSWVQNAYALAFGGLLLLGARAGDILGRRRMFLWGLALFTVAPLAIGLARNPTWLICARAAQGVGAAILVPSTLAVLTVSFAEGRESTRAVAYDGAVAGIRASRPIQEVPAGTTAVRRADPGDPQPASPECEPRRAMHAAVVAHGQHIHRYLSATTSATT